MSSGEPSPQLRVVTVGIDSYEHFKQLNEAAAQAKQVAGVFGDKAHSVIVPAGTWAEVIEGLEIALPLAAADHSPPSGLLVYWAGHGYLQEKDKFCLAATNTNPDATAMITAELIADYAARTGAEQILVVIDACFSGAGVVDAATKAIPIIKERKKYTDTGATWIAVFASAMDWQDARDDWFAPQFLRLLRSGPTTDEYRNRWTAYNQVIYGEDLIEALQKEWSGPGQLSDPLRWGTVARFLPNPLFQGDRMRGVPAQLVDAATGGGGGDGDFFTGRTELLSKLVEVVRSPQPGMHVLTGPPESGKSAVLGWLACRSDPKQRAKIKGHSEVTDPGENSIAGVVVARRLSVTELTNALDLSLSNGFLPADRAGQRGIGELLDAIEATGRCPVVVVDGLDEAGVDRTGQEAWAVAQKVLRPLALVASVIVSTRDRAAQTPMTHVAQPSGMQATPGLTATSLVAALTAEASRVFNMLDLVDEPGDIETYVAARLDGIDAAMDPAAVASYVNEIADKDLQGRFLFARLLTARLREHPIDTHLPNWRESLVDSVEESFDQTIADLEPMQRDGDVVAGAAKDLLAALAWAFGAGMPDDVWAPVATALSPKGTRYSRNDVFWALQVAGRFIVEDGNGTQAAYRLASHRLAEHLVSQASDDAAVKVAEAVQELLLQRVEAGRDPKAETYLRKHAWQHCAQAGDAGIKLLESAEERAPGSFRRDLALALDAFCDQLSYSDKVKAIEVAQRAVVLLREIDDEDMIATRIAALTRLALLHADQQQFDAATAISKEAVGTARSEAESTWITAAPTLADTLCTYAAIQRIAEEFDGAVKAAEEAIGLYRTIVHRSPDYRFDLAGALTQAGLAYREAAQPDRALRAIREATKMFAELAESCPEYRYWHATSLSNLGLVSRDAGHVSDALQPALDAVALQRTLAAEDPEIEPSLVVALNNLGMIYRDLGRPADAIEPLSDVVARYDSHHVGAEPGWTATLVLALNNLVVSLRDVGRSADAIPLAERAVALGRKAGDDPAVQPYIGPALANLAMAYVDLGNIEQGTKLAREALDRYGEPSGEKESRSNPSVLAGVAWISDNLGQLLLGSGHAELALPLAERSTSLYESLAEINRTARPSWYLAKAHLGLVYLGLGRELDAAGAIQSAHVMMRSYVDGLPEEQRSAGLIGQLAAVIGYVGMLLQAVDVEIALPLAEESARLYRHLALGQLVYRRDLIEVLVLCGELVAKTLDRDRAGAMLGELADELISLVDLGRVARLRVASALARLATAASNAGDPRGGAWADEAAALAEPGPGDTTPPAEAEQLASTALDVRAEVLTSQAAAAEMAGDFDRALQAADDCVTTMRSLTDPALRATRSATALMMVAGIAQSAGDRGRAISAVQDARKATLEMGSGLPYFLTLAQTGPVLSWALDDPELTSRVYADFPDDGVRLVVLMRSLATAPETVMTKQLIDGEAWTSGGPAPVVVTWRGYCRQRRAQDLAAFDSAWLDGHDEVPAWLKIDPKFVRLTGTWLTIPSAPEACEFHLANAEGLADPAVRTLLDEYVMANPQASFYRVLLDTAVEVGIEQAYAPLLLGALFDELKVADAENWPRLLASHRDLLGQPGLLDVFVSHLVDPNPEDQLIVAALALAARDKDAAVFTAVAESDRVQPLLTELADDPKTILHATLILLAFASLEPAETAEVCFARAIALARLGQSDKACELAEQVAAADPERKPARLEELIKQVANVPQLAPLLHSFAP